MKIMKRYIAMGLLLLLLGGTVSCVTDSIETLADTPAQLDMSFQPEESGGDSIVTVTPTPVPDPEPPAIDFADSYDEIGAALLSAEAYWNRTAADWETPVDEAPAGEAAVTFSDTNVQVAGIDEADVVETDGEYIYILDGDRVGIYRAAGADTVLVGACAVNGSWDGAAQVVPMECVGLYLAGDVLLAIGEAWLGEETGNAGYTRTIVRVFDVSDPQNVTFCCEYSQDGSYNSSRLMDGQLYLITIHWNWDYDPAVPESYIPCVHAHVR